MNNISLKIALLSLKQRQLMIRADAASDKHKWITTETGSHIKVDGDGNIVAGAGGKFNGKPLSEMGGTKKFTKYATNAERAETAKQANQTQTLASSPVLSNNLTKQESAGALSSTSQSEAANGDRTMNSHSVTKVLKSGNYVKVDGTPESKDRNSSMIISIIGKDGNVIKSRHQSFVKSANLEDKKEGIYGWVGDQAVGSETWYEIEKAMSEVQKGMPKYEYSVTDIANSKKADEYDDIVNEGDRSGGSYNPYRDKTPSTEQIKKDDLAANEARRKANSEKFKDTDFFAN